MSGREETPPRLPLIITLVVYHLASSHFIQTDEVEHILHGISSVSEKCDGLGDGELS